VFFYARLWRRSGVLTDLEFYEIRYSGWAASVVRGFRAVYLGLFFNCMIMATVNLAAVQDRGHPVRDSRVADAGCSSAAERRLRRALGPVGRARHRHDPVLHQDDGRDRRGVLRAAAPQVGGLAGSWKAVAHAGPGGILNYLNMLPDFTSNWDLAVAVFIMPIAVQWWAVWYPGAEPGGGSYIAQRMLASKSERTRSAAVLFFNVAHYVLRPWPWILVGLAR
jgi:solute:Na+ symporter, SSS family